MVALWLITSWKRLTPPAWRAVAGAPVKKTPAAILAAAAAKDSRFLLRRNLSMRFLLTDYEKRDAPRPCESPAGRGELYSGVAPECNFFRERFVREKKRRALVDPPRNSKNERLVD